MVRRFEQVLLDEGHPVQVVRAVLPHAGQPARAERMAADLAKLLTDERFQRLSTALQRVLRIVPADTLAHYDPQLFQDGLHGLMRVRAFTQDDAHIFITEEQIADEVLKVNDLILSIYADFGFDDVRIKFSDRPEKRIGDDAVWDKAEAALKKALDASGRPWTLNKGEGAFYGPKLEYVLRDAIGRDWQCGTIQVDLNMPGRLGAFYIDEHSDKVTPVMLHRAMFGSLERFTGYVPNERFNALRGDRRMLFYDTANGRQIDVFVGTFAMCHTLDLSGRLTLVPDTLTPADLVLTKLQIVEINTKDLVDAAQLLRNHQLGRGGEAGRDEVSLDRLAAVTSADWGWHTTLSDNLAKLAGFARDALAEPDARVVVERVEAVQRAIDEPGKSLRWKARARIGRHAPWYELPEEVTGNPHG